MLMTGLAIAQAGTSILSGIFGAAANRSQARAQARASTQERDFNLNVLRQQKIDQLWADQMSMWRSGLAVTAGTTADTVVANNQDVLEDNINFQEEQYNLEIAAAKKAAKQKFLGVF